MYTSDIMLIKGKNNNSLEKCYNLCTEKAKNDEKAQFMVNK